MPIPEGLMYFPDIIHKSLEGKILTYFTEHPEEQKPLFKDKREVRQYGYAYDYSKRGIGKKIDVFPDCIKELISLIPEIAMDEKVEPTSYFNQCIANRYLQGEGIGVHSDHRSFGNVIACFTLQNGIEMEFRRGDEVHKIYVEPRSLYVMKDDARWKWDHQIRPRKSDHNPKGAKRLPRSTRWSVTYRHVKE